MPNESIVALRSQPPPLRSPVVKMPKYLRSFSLVLLLWTACDAIPVPPGTPCYTYGENQCNYNLECNDGACFYRCDAIGDCDPGFLCTQNFCLRECKETNDCGPRRICLDLQHGQQGRACQIAPCFTDEECRDDEVCSYSRCTSQCRPLQNDCLDDEFCDTDNRERKTCQNGGFGELF